MRFALESYRQANGEYPPVGVGCGAWAFPGCQSTGGWIQGLTPEYLEDLPEDPRQSGGGNMADPAQFSYRYRRVTTTSFQLTVKLENTTDSDLNGTNYGLQSDLYVVTEAK